MNQITLIGGPRHGDTWVGPSTPSITIYDYVGEARNGLIKAHIYEVRGDVAELVKEEEVNLNERRLLWGQ
jgi:hypothetical protein